MRNLFKTLGIIALVAVMTFAFVFIGCSDGGDDDDSDKNGNSSNGGNGGGGYTAPQRGLLTIGSLPSGWVIRTCYISSNGSYQFHKYDNGYVNMPTDDNWKLYSIGRGTRTAYDKLEISVEKYINMNGALVIDNNQYNTDFNYTGTASVYLYFEGYPEGVENYTFGVNNVTFLNGNATINFSAIYNPSSGGGDGGGDGGGPSLSNDIDSTLYGTWVDTLDGNTLTITFASNGITWGGSAGSAVNATTSAYNGPGYTFVWVAGNGNISYKYSYQGQVYTMPVYTYRIEGGNLILSVSGIDFVTMNKQP